MINVSDYIERYFGKVAGQLYRFVIVGGFVTVLSLALAYVFLKWLNTPLIPTYVLLYASTILLSYFLNSSYTFKAGKDLRSLLLFYGSYILTLVCGTLALGLLRRYLKYENWVLAFMVVPFTMVVNFILSSFIFKPLMDKGTKHAQ